MIHNTLISLRPLFILVAIGLLIYLRVLYVRHRNNKEDIT